MTKQFDNSFLNLNLTEDKKFFIKKIEKFELFFKNRINKFAKIFDILSNIKINNKHDKNTSLEHLTNSLIKDFENITIDKSTILYFHSVLCEDDPKLEKNFRSIQNYIYTKSEKYKINKLRFTPLPPKDVENSIIQLCDAFNKEWKKQNANKIYLICIFLTDFVHIHPFSDGNGRTSRLIAMVLFLQAGFSVLKYVSFENIVHKRRGLYYQSLHKSQVGWYENTNDYWPFVLNMLLTLQDAYKVLDRKFIIEGYKQNHNQEWLETALLYSIIPYRVNDIASALPDFSTDLIQQTIDKLVSEGKLAKLSPGNIYHSLIWDKK